MLAVEATDADGGASSGIVAAQVSYADPWTKKLGDDSTQFYDWVVEYDTAFVTIVGESATTISKTLTYVHPNTGRAYSAEQVAALRESCTQLSLGTRMVATTTEDNTVTIFSGGESLLLTPHPSHTEDLTAFYLWGDRQYDTTVASGAPKHSLPGLVGLTHDGANFLLPDRVDMTVLGSGGASFGWMKSSFMIKTPLVPSLVIPPGSISSTGDAHRFSR